MKTLKTLIRYSIISVLVLLAASHAHAMKAPDVVVKETVDAMVSKIQANRDVYSADNQALYQMLEETLIPALHVQRMADQVLGKKYASSATQEQRAAFAQEFKNFIINTYATGLLGATGKEKVEYQPVVLAPGADKVKVRAELVSESGSRFPITLSMSNRSDTSWRAYNMEVAGINFIRTYRATFAATLESKGVEGLIADLRQKNAS